MNRPIDLHTHSNASDGSDTPAALLKNANDAGLAAIALCDHDTVSGLEEFENAAKEYPELEAVPGVELSTRLFSKEVHIVGLYIDRTCPALAEPLSYLRQSRLTRNKRILERLQTAGFMVTEEDVSVFAQGESAGRPHIARALVEKGYFETVQQAFVKCLKPGTPFYVGREFLPPDQCIQMIHDAGGLAIWAHPMHERRGDRAFLRKFLKQMMGWGLDGMETRYALFTERQLAITNAVADELGLLKSGGSDYHGANQPTIQLGVGTGNLEVPYDFLAALKERKNSKKSVNKHYQTSKKL